MLIPTQLRVVALNSPLARLHPATRGFAPIFVRAKGLSAIIRGAIRSERVQNGPDSFDARNAYHDTGRRKVGGGRLTRPKEPPTETETIFLQSSVQGPLTPVAHEIGVRNRS
ncbi:hypothetical protein NW765_001019 [Fusarium oxysporum]|nr:hypothetical protein NW765_001019 [Fusarium oxysporum]